MNRIDLIKKIAKKLGAEDRRSSRPNSRENRHATRVIEQANQMEAIEYDGGRLKRYRP